MFYYNPIKTGQKYYPQVIVDKCNTSTQSKLIQSTISQYVKLFNTFCSMPFKLHGNLK